MTRSFVLLAALLLLLGCATFPRAGADPAHDPTAPALQPGAAESLLDEGRALVGQGRYAEAAGLFEQVSADPAVRSDFKVLALAGAFLSWHLLGDREQERLAARRYFRPTTPLSGSGGTVLPPTAAADLRWLRYVALRVVAAADAERRLDVAAGPRNPIPLLAPSEAGETISWIRCGPKLEGHFLIRDEVEKQVRGVEYIVYRLRCSKGPAVRHLWFDLSLWYGFTATHLEGTAPPMGFTREDAERIVRDEFGRSVR